MLNAESTLFLLTLNPTINIVKEDLDRIPFPLHRSDSLDRITVLATHHKVKNDLNNEVTFDFIALPHWDTGLADQTATEARLADLERQIDNEVYRLYGIGDKDRAAIEAELAGGVISEDDEMDHAPRSTPDDQEAEPEVAAPMTQEELAVRWISYAVGVVLERFKPGVPGALGSAIYRCADFAVGSLPAPDEAEFDQLVGSPERFAYVDAEGGRHLFSAEVEQALRDLAVPDGIAVLDEGHPRDLPALVEQALELMLDGDGSVTRKNVMRKEENYGLRFTHYAADVIRIGANGDIRRFLERDFFTKYHLRWYRKRPVYWPLQSAKRSYGFVLFHEQVDRMTLYTLQRDYLDHKLNGLRLGIGDLQGQLAAMSSSARKQAERKLDKASQLLDELTEFAATMERVVRAGYQPEENWIDDGVILRLAPLWELIPLWKSEPRSHWEWLEQGDFDWSHIAMRYWPARVREKCKTDKSYAIAHGHEEWYKGR